MQEAIALPNLIARGVELQRRGGQVRARRGRRARPHGRQPHQGFGENSGLHGIDGPRRHARRRRGPPARGRGPRVLALGPRPLRRALGRPASAAPPAGAARRPSPSAPVSASTRSPPCAWASSRAMARPRPAPPGSAEPANGWNSLGCARSGTPGPLSATRTTAARPSSARLTAIMPLRRRAADRSRSPRGRCACRLTRMRCSCSGSALTHAARGADEPQADALGGQTGVLGRRPRGRRQASIAGAGAGSSLLP